MAGARKGDDLRRGPRFALHSPPADPVEGDEAAWSGEAKISGRAVRVGEDGAGEDGAGDGAGDGADLFRADISEVVLVHLDEKATRLVAEWWTASRGLRRVERD